MISEMILCFCAFLWLKLFCGFCRRLGGGGAEGTVGGAVAAVLGLFLGHVDALLRFAVELRGGTVIVTILGINPDSDRRNTARWRRRGRRRGLLLLRQSR